MLKKLFKYDMKYNYKVIIIFYVLTIFFAILTRGLYSLEKTIMIRILSGISAGCMYSMIANALINTLIRNWLRFKETLYGEEAYLTHTLPVSKNNIYQSKFLVSFINLFTTFLVVLLAIFIAYYTKERWIIISNYLNGIGSMINVSAFIIAITFIFLTFLEVFNGLQGGFLGIILGHKKNNNKVFYSILFGFIVYMASQLIVLLISYILGIFDNNIMLLFTTNNITNIETFKTVFILAIVIYILLIALINYLCVRELKKGVNVE